MFKVFSYRLYPSNAQRQRLESVLETARRFYNDCLGERKAVYETEKKTVGKTEQLRRVKIHKANNPFASNVHSHVLQVVVVDLDKAYKAFFRRVKAGDKAGFPRFKTQQRFHSFGYKQYCQGFKIDGRRLRLWGIGRIAVRWHRPLEGKIKTLRIVRKVGKWYAFFCCEVEPQPLPVNPAEVGIDAGLTSLFTLSTGEHIDNPRWYRKSQKKHRVLQRSVARKKKGGSNRRKAIRRLAKHSADVANQRKDFLNKLICTLVSCFGYIAIEDLNVSRMVHGNLAKSILDAGWGYFKRHLLGKAANAGRKVALIDPAYTTQDCCQCGQRQALTLSDRWYRCICGNSRDRDENAALNVLQAGRVCWSQGSAMAGLDQEAAGP